MSRNIAAHWTPYGVTALLLAAIWAAMAIWTRNVGIEEDWFVVDAWLGREPDLATWLWSQNNEHRLPIGRAIYLTLMRMTGDFRSGMVASQLLLVALSILFIRLAVHLRGGRARFSDALFPLALLHLGHWENLLWGWQIQFVSSVFLTGVLLWAVVRRDRPGPREAGVAAAAMTLLPLSGANGIAVSLGMVPWALYAAFLVRREERLAAGLMVAGALLAIGLTLIYFVGYQSVSWSPRAETAGQFLIRSKAYFSMPLGPFARPIEISPGQWSRPLDLLPSLVVLATMVLGGLGALAAFIYRGRFTDARSLGLAAFIGCNILLGFIVAYSRAAEPTYLPSRYALFAVMPLIATVYVVQVYGPPKIARYFPAILAGLLLVLMPLNVRAGFVWRDWYLGVTQAFEADARRGLPLEEVAARNNAMLLHSCDGCLLRHLVHLRAAGIEPFASLPPPAAETRGRPAG